MIDQKDPSVRAIAARYVCSCRMSGSGLLINTGGLSVPFLVSDAMTGNALLVPVSIVMGCESAEVEGSIVGSNSRCVSVTRVLRTTPAASAEAASISL